MDGCGIIRIQTWALPMKGQMGFLLYLATSNPGVIHWQKAAHLPETSV